MKEKTSVRSVGRPRKSRPEDFTELELQEYREQLKEAIYRYVRTQFVGTFPGQMDFAAVPVSRISAVFWRKAKRLYGEFVLMHEILSQDVRLMVHKKNSGGFMVAPVDLLRKHAPEVFDPLQDSARRGIFGEVRSDKQIREDREKEQMYKEMFGTAGKTASLYVPDPDAKTVKDLDTD